jgi:hypothetical protein
MPRTLIKLIPSIAGWDPVSVSVDLSNRHPRRSHCSWGCTGHRTRYAALCKPSHCRRPGLRHEGLVKLNVISSSIEWLARTIDNVLTIRLHSVLCADPNTLNSCVIHLFFTRMQDLDMGKSIFLLPHLELLRGSVTSIVRGVHGPKIPKRRPPF